ncbi:MAG TPA: LptA/OstA family protein [Candidatus Limnocylindrales bacterium]|nr:LptA/OstA family protein [Candidatus Limnocylindrales bacterium]
MKIFGYITLMALAGAGPLRAQMNTNTNAVGEILALVTTNAPAPKPQPRPETLIEADGPADFDLAGHKVIYHEHVRVDSTNMKMSCEWLAADLPQTGGRVTNIVAETNVVIDATDDKGQKMHATGDQAVYVFSVENGVTNETVTLTGNARLENTQGWLTGDSIIWDRAHERLSVPSNPKMIFHQAINGMTAGTNSVTVQTNSPLVETNLPPVATRPPATDTNPPPAKPDPAPKPALPPKNL